MGKGVEPLRCQRSPRMECPRGAGGKGPLPATLAILGLESNQIRRSPQSPQQLHRTAVWPPRARGGWNGASCPPPISLLLRGVSCKRTSKRAQKGSGLQAENWASPTLCWATVTVEMDLSALLSAHSLRGKPLPGIFPGPSQACQSKFLTPPSPRHVHPPPVPSEAFLVLS